MTCFIKICRKRSANAANRLFALDSIDFFKELYQTLIQAAVCQQSQTSNTFPKLVLPMISNLEKPIYIVLVWKVSFQQSSDSGQRQLCYTIYMLQTRYNRHRMSAANANIMFTFQFYFVNFFEKGIFYSMFII